MTKLEEQPFWDHLDELAKRLRRILIAVFLATIVFSTLPSDPQTLLKLDFTDYRPIVSIILEIIQNRLLPEGVNLIAFNWLDAFYIYILVSLALGILVTLPYIAYQLYQFIMPALYVNERRYAVRFILAFVALFSVGALYAYFLLLPTTFRVLYRFVYQTRISPLYSVKDFFNMVALGLVGSGLFYTFPIVVYMLVKADLIDVETLKSNRKQVFVVLAVFTAILTPDPTPFSMLLMSIPFYLLYEVTIQILQRTSGGEEDTETLERGIMASRRLLQQNVGE
jgi:sec-independent protein translocase protein TatC